MYPSAKRFQRFLDVAPSSFMVQFEVGQDPAELSQKLAEFGASALSVIAQANPEEGRGPLLLVEMPTDQSPREAVETLARIPGVVFAEPNEIVTALEKGEAPRSIIDPTNPGQPAGAPASSAIDMNNATPPDGVDMIVSIDAVSNDTGYANGSLWGMYGDKTTIANPYGSQAGEAWAAGFTGTMKTVIGVIDTGIDYTHPDLYLNIWLNQGEISTALRAVLKDVDGDGLITFRDLNNAINAKYVTDINKNGYIDAGDLLRDARWADGRDEDRNGFIDDLIGWDFANKDNDPFDDNGHGTHVSGTIGAMGGNGTGVVGVDWNVQIVAMKFMDASGSGSLSSAIQAVNYFTAEAKLAPTGENFVATNNSWGGGGFSQALSDAVTLAAKNDILFIAAAGNSASNNDVIANYPSNLSTIAGAGYEAVIAVAALTSTGGLSYFSSYGATTVDLAAPGYNIYSTLPGGAYGTLSGTSMATPYVTGAAALYASAHPDATAAEIRAALLASTDATASLAGLVVNSGRLDVGNLMAFSPSTPADIAGALSTTSVLSAGAPCQSVIDVAGDQDWFKVSLTKGYIYTFTMDAAAGSTLNAYLRLLDSAGNTLVANDDLNGWNAGLAVIANMDVTCFISAQGSQTSTGAYSLSMTTALGSLNLAGTSGADNLVGAAGNDSLSGLGGNDTLDGGQGADTMIGGLGNEVYLVDDSGDVVVENASEGTDVVNASVSYALGSNVENLTLTGTLAINGAGNTLNNIITGNAAANIIDGGAGADTMAGGAGNDAYVVDNAGDIVMEAASAGTDSVSSSVSYALTANVENLTLTGSAALNAIGNALNNVLTGNVGANVIDGGAGLDVISGGVGNDTLNGGLGADTLDGGAGVDVFVFNSALGPGNIDRLNNFVTADDTIQLDHTIFTAIGDAGALAVGAFNTGVAATQADDRIIYNKTTGALFYDADGSGQGLAMQFATLSGMVGTLSAADFVVF